MGGNYFGEPNLGNGGSSSSSSSSSRKGKKSNSDKPKQPQRGLGVAQLENIRLHNQMGNCAYTTIPSPYPIANPNQQVDISLQSTPYPSSSSFSYTSVPSPSSYGIHAAQSVMMGISEPERANVRYADSQLPSTNARWNAGATVVDAQQYYQQPSLTRNLLNLQVDHQESTAKKKKKDRSDSMRSGSQNSRSSGNQEPDLELRLSL